MGRSGIKTHPNHVNNRQTPRNEWIVLPNKATGMVMTETMMKIHFHAGKPFFPRG
jgi:hypothetical protein